MVVTIHQPSWNVFSLFHNVYMLSKDTGSFIYDGPPTDVIPEMKQFGFNCPRYYNPADFLIEIACGGEGKEAVKALSVYQGEVFRRHVAQEPQVPAHRLASLEQTPVFPFFSHFYVLLIRSFIISVRDIWLIIVSCP